MPRISNISRVWPGRSLHPRWCSLKTQFCIDYWPLTFQSKRLVKDLCKFILSLNPLVPGYPHQRIKCTALRRDVVREMSSGIPKLMAAGLSKNSDIGSIFVWFQLSLLMSSKRCHVNRASWISSPCLSVCLFVSPSSILLIYLSKSRSVNVCLSVRPCISTVCYNLTKI